MRRVLFAAFAAAAAVVLAASPALAADPAADPAIAVSGLHTTPGHAGFYLAARDLPYGTQLATAALTVTVGDRTLDAKVSALGTDTAAPTPKRATMLVLDVSGSMRGARLASAKTAALAYVRALPPDVAIGLVSVSSTAKVVVAPTKNRGAVTSAVNGLTAGGTTALYDGIGLAVSKLAAWPDDHRVVLLTDGEDSSSTSTVAAATAAATGAHVSIDTVGFLTNAKAEGVLSQLAHDTGGREYTAADDAGLANAFQAAAGWFGTQLEVDVTVPAALSGADARMQIVVKAGDVTVTTTTPVTFAIDPSVPVTQTQVNAPPASATPYMVVGGVVFAAILVVGLLGVGPMFEYAQRRRRVGQLTSYSVSAPEPERESTSLAASALAATESIVRARGLDGAITARLDRAGMRMRSHEWVLLRAVVTLVLVFVLSIVTNILFGAIAGVVLGVGGTWGYQELRIGSRRRKFAAGLPDALQLVVGSLRSGFSLPQAVQAMAREVSEPMATEFGRALAETRLGVELEDALNRLAIRMGSTDLGWVVVAVKVQREVGGNLAEVLTRTVETMRERESIRGQVRALAAEGKLSAWILVMLPLILGTYMVFVRPAYVRPLFTEPAGIIMLVVGFVLLAVGGFWMARAVKVEV